MRKNLTACSVGGFLYHRAELSARTRDFVNRVAGSCFDNGSFRVYFEELHYAPVLVGRFCVFRLLAAGIEADIFIEDKVLVRIFGVGLAALPGPYVDYLTARVGARLGLIFVGQKECLESDVQKPAYQVVVESQESHFPVWLDLDQARVDSRFLTWRASHLPGKLPLHCSFKVGSTALTTSEVAGLEEGDIVFLRPV
ncbi:MAG: hypothetical protein OXC07_03750 [Kistimonas sp.]|nr:hypothetical protein [Kistimonas sp.]